MRVLVTGASGFVGHAVCAELNARGHETFALVRRPGSEPPGTTAIQGDIAKDEPLDFTEAKPEAVIHLAAEIASQRDEAKIHATNVEGTKRVTDAAKRSQGNPKLV